MQSKRLLIVLGITAPVLLAGCASGPEPMPNIDTMTVRQLLDIVAFLDSRYELVVEDYD